MAKPFARSTIKEVASIASVSTQTVARVINEGPDVSLLVRIPHRDGRVQLLRAGCELR